MLLIGIVLGGIFGGTSRPTEQRVAAVYAYASPC